MFRKTRREIIASIMGSLVLLLAAVFTVLILTDYYEMRRENEEMLARYAEIYSLERLPGSEEDLPQPPGMEGELPLPSGADGNVPGPPETDDVPGVAPLFQLSSFYSVAFSPEGEVLYADLGKNGLYEKETLVKIAENVRKTSERSGLEGSLLFRVEEKEGYTLVAFVDNTVAAENLAFLIRLVLIVGIAALAVLFFLSLFLSGRIVRPLEENDRKEKQFISDAGHELKTPVSVISANAELLSRQVGQNEWLDNIRYENDRMGTLVKELLDLARAENAKARLEELDLSRLVTGEALPFESVAYEAGLTIRSNIEEDITVKGNDSQLRQLVSILLDNAIRHAEGGREILLTLRRQAKYAYLTVENSGKEIPPEVRKHLFERFFRVDDVRNGEDRHYGLGLAIARAVAEAHDGRISVSCTDGRVIFTVSLPLKNH